MAACADYLSKKTLLSALPDGSTYFFRFDAATLFHAHVVCTLSWAVFRTWPSETGSEPPEISRHRWLPVRERLTSNDVTWLAWLPQALRMKVSKLATSVSLKTSINGGMPKGRGLPAVAGA